MKEKIIVPIEENTVSLKNMHLCQTLIIRSIHDPINNLKIEFTSLEFPNFPIWTARCVNYPSDWVVDCVHNQVLRLDDIRVLIKNTLEKNDDFFKTVDIKVIVNRSFHIGKVQLLDGDIGSIMIGEFDDLGRLHGYAEIADIETNPGKIKKISGIFVKHHFVSGRILICFSSHQIEFIIHPDLTKKHNVVVSSPGRSTEEVFYTMTLDRLNDHSFKVPESETLTDVQWLGIQSSTIKKREYHGLTKGLRLHGQGKEILISNEADGSVVTNVLQGEYKNNILRRNGAVETTTVIGDLRIMSKITFTECNDFNSYIAIEEKTIETHAYIEKQRKTGVFNCSSIVKGEFKRSFTQAGNHIEFITKGSFDQSEELNSNNAQDLDELNCYFNERLLETRKGLFEKGEFIQGCMIKYAENGSKEELYGKFISVQENQPTLLPSVGFEYLENQAIFTCKLDDPNGMRIVYLSGKTNKKVEFCLGNFILNDSSCPKYILELETIKDKEQLKTVTLPGEWKVIYKNNGDFNFELLLQSGKKQDKKTIDNIKKKALDVCHDIENNLIKVNILPPHSMNDLIKEEEEERKSFRSAKAAQKKEAEDIRRAKQAFLDKKHAEEQRKKNEALAAVKRQKEERRRKQQEHEAFLLEKYRAEASVFTVECDDSEAEHSIAGITPDHPKAELAQGTVVQNIENDEAEAEVPIVFNSERLLDPDNRSLFFHQAPSMNAVFPWIRKQGPLPIL